MHLGHGKAYNPGASSKLHNNLWRVLLVRLFKFEIVPVAMGMLGYKMKENSRCIPNDATTFWDRGIEIDLESE